MRTGIALIAALAATPVMADDEARDLAIVKLWMSLHREMDARIDVLRQCGVGQTPDCFNAMAARDQTSQDTVAKLAHSAAAESRRAARRI